MKVAPRSVRVATHKASVPFGPSVKYSVRLSELNVGLHSLAPGKPCSRTNSGGPNSPAAQRKLGAGWVVSVFVLEASGVSLLVPTSSLPEAEPTLVESLPSSPFVESSQQLESLRFEPLPIASLVFDPLVLESRPFESFELESRP